MKCSGIFDAKQIAADLGIPLRTIQRLKLDIACAMGGAATSANDATYGVSESANSAMGGAASSANDATHGVGQTTDKTPALLSKVSNIITTTVHHAEREDGRTDGDFVDCKAAFNGSTEAMLAIIETAMGGHCRANAAQWLANLVRINGQQPVAEAYQKFLTARAEGHIIARPLPWLDATAKSCKRDAAAKLDVDNPFAEQTKGVVRFAKPAPGSDFMAGVGRA